MSWLLFVSSDLKDSGSRSLSHHPSLIWPLFEIQFSPSLFYSFSIEKKTSSKQGVRLLRPCKSSSLSFLVLDLALPQPGAAESSCFRCWDSNSAEATRAANVYIWYQEGWSMFGRDGLFGNDKNFVLRQGWAIWGDFCLCQSGKPEKTVVHCRECSEIVETRKSYQS